AVPAAAPAGTVNDGAFTRAGRTRRHGEELTEERMRLVTQLAGPAARAARHRLCTRLGPGTRAFGAGLEALDADGLRCAAGDFGERELQADFDVVAAAPVAPRALATPEQTLEPCPPAPAASGQPEVAH